MGRVSYGSVGRRAEWATIWLVGSCVVLACVGCGGGANLGPVSGTVTLDDQPLARATVTFMPDGGGGASFGETDSEGRYTLTHSEGGSGAVIGTHTISIEVEQEQEHDPDALEPEDGEKAEVTKEAPQVVPAVYNEDTELTEEVKSGPNEFNFDLRSDAVGSSDDEDDDEDDDY